jgi:23S rRNA (cytidine1920-2'-O)/16S rRNA (cytidine1409-2'-O)-methyltransferase
MPFKTKRELTGYASRGGIKLAHALKYFNIDANNKIALDIGASTGGFTDCLLKAGAKKVYAIDVGYGILDYALRCDKRVKVIERENFRYTKFKTIGELVDLITIDVSFISLEKIIPNAINFLKNMGELIILIKPQFEARREEVPKGGIITNEKIIDRIVLDIKQFCENLNLANKGQTEIPIIEKGKNKEIIMYLIKEN